MDKIFGNFSMYRLLHTHWKRRNPSEEVQKLSRKKIPSRRCVKKSEERKEVEHTNKFSGNENWKRIVVRAHMFTMYSRKHEYSSTNPENLQKQRNKEQPRNVCKGISGESRAFEDNKQSQISSI